MAGEEIVRYLLHMWNYSMFVPLNPSSPFDLVIKNDEEWITIQIKHSRSVSVPLTREGKSNGARIKREYKKGDSTLHGSLKHVQSFLPQGQKGHF